LAIDRRRALREVEAGTTVSIEGEPRGRDADIDSTDRQDRTGCGGEQRKGKAGTNEFNPEGCFSRSKEDEISVDSFRKGEDRSGCIAVFHNTLRIA
jgi:hypothetical protein